MSQAEDNQTFREIVAEGAVRDVGWNTPVLVVNRGPNAGFRFPLYDGITTAGRDPRSDIFLEDVTVSRHHAEFRLGRGELQVVDVGGLNGTYRQRPADRFGCADRRRRDSDWKVPAGVVDPARHGLTPKTIGSRRIGLSPS